MDNKQPRKVTSVKKFVYRSTVCAFAAISSMFFACEEIPTRNGSPPSREPRHPIGGFPRQAGGTRSQIRDNSGELESELQTLEFQRGEQLARAETDEDILQIEGWTSARRKYLLEKYRKKN